MGILTRSYKTVLNIYFEYFHIYRVNATKYNFKGCPFVANSLFFVLPFVLPFDERNYKTGLMGISTRSYKTILGKGKCYKIHDRFEHTFGSIRAILAEIEAFQNYGVFQAYTKTCKGASMVEALKI